MDENLIPFLRNHADRERREGRELNAARVEEAADALEQLRELLRLVQSDRGNWLHSRLQDAIEAAVGPPAPYRPFDDDGTADSASTANSGSLKEI